MGAGKAEIVTAATAVAAAAAGKPYTWGGHTTNGFDCSGFVNYTLRQAYPNFSVPFITAGQMFTDARFTAATPPPEPGDLICFKQGPGISHDHIGIVIDAQTWIGSQSSTGVAKVSMTNPYWSGKTHFFLRMK